MCSNYLKCAKWIELKFQNTAKRNLVLTLWNWFVASKLVENSLTFGWFFFQLCHTHNGIISKWQRQSSVVIENLFEFRKKREWQKIKKSLFSWISNFNLCNWYIVGWELTEFSWVIRLKHQLVEFRPEENDFIHFESILIVQFHIWTKLLYNGNS